MVLRKMCREHRQLPSSYTTTDELRWIEGLPCGGGGNADVWRGVYRESTVAIKVLRVNSRVDFAGLERVRPFARIRKSTCTEEGSIEILLRSGPVEAVQAPEPVTVDVCEKNFANPGDDFQVDGAWYHHGLHHRTSGDKSAKTGKYFPRGLNRM